MKELISRWLYASLLRLATPLYLLRLWRRGAAEAPYRQHLGERLGLYDKASEAGWVWVHAVSLGETLAAKALIHELRLLKPGLRLLLTHSTATGREAGAALLQEGDAQAWLPYDTPGAVRRFLRHWQPSVGVLMETEIWPVLQHESARVSLPLVLANARLSEKSFRQGRRLRWLMEPAAAALKMALAQTEADARRLRDSGVRNVQVCGNLKFDLHPDESLLARGRAWHAALKRPVLLFAVSREGEEAMLLSAFTALPPASRPLLLIVPRHPQRFDEVAGLIEAAGLKLARRSSFGGEPTAEALSADAWLGDSLREMALYYGMADAALLGGSFLPLGGQNLIEAAACGCPLLMGPHTFNFAQAAELALEAGAALRVVDMSEGLGQARALIADTSRREAMAGRAELFAAVHRGAARRMAQALMSR